MSCLILQEISTEQCITSLTFAVFLKGETYTQTQTIPSWKHSNIVPRLSNVYDGTKRQNNKIEIKYADSIYFFCYSYSDFHMNSRNIKSSLLYVGTSMYNSCLNFMNETEKLLFLRRNQTQRKRWKERQYLWVVMPCRDICFIITKINCITIVHYWQCYCLTFSTVLCQHYSSFWRIPVFICTIINY